MKKQVSICGSFEKSMIYTKLTIFSPHTATLYVQYLHVVSSEHVPWEVQMD